MASPNSWESGFDAACATSSFSADVSNMLPEEPPPKRRKIQLACSCCRVRKTRCDGRRPVCLRCETRGTGTACLYEEGTSKTRKRIEALENRLKQLENGTSSATARLDDNPAANQENALLTRSSQDHLPKPSIPCEDEFIARSVEPGLLIRSTMHAVRNQSTIHKESATAVLSRKATASDALATVSTYHRDPNLLFGASSTIAFVEHVLHTTGETDNFRDLSKLRAGDGRAAMHSIEESDRNERYISGLETLPIRRVSDSYLTSFWEIVHPVFPILHKPTFMSFYNKLWAPTSFAEASRIPEDPVMLATLNLALAIGCRFSESVDLINRAFLSDQFYQRARRLVSFDALDMASIPIVQMLLLTAVHLQSTAYSSRCWNTVGLAIRVAQGVGLHLIRSKSEIISQLEREMRRRLWYTCVTLDRLICMTFGRPAMLSHSPQVPLPLMVDDEYLLENGEGAQPVTIQSQMGLFVISLRLFDILSEVLNCFYAQDSAGQISTAIDHQDRSVPDLHDMLRLNSKLDQFLETLPSNLRLENVSEYSEVPTGRALLQARILYCRFLYTRLLLLRPVILSLGRSAKGANSDPMLSDKSSLGGEIARKMCQVCLSTAHELISVLHKDKDSVYRCSAWWTIYFTFGATIVVIASLLCFPEDDTRSSIDNSCSLAMAIFRHYAPELESATQAIQVLEGLRDRISHALDKGARASHREESQQPQRRPNDCLHQGSEALYGSLVSDVECRVQDFSPDPLSENWFTRQMLNFDIQDFL